MKYKSKKNSKVDGQVMRVGIPFLKVLSGITSLLSRITTFIARKAVGFVFSDPISLEAQLKFVVDSLTKTE